MKRGKPIARTPFKPKVYERAPTGRQWEGDNLPTPRFRNAENGVTATFRSERQVAALFRPMPKGEPSRPGKRAPTKVESEWMDGLVAYGCVACHVDGLGFVAPHVHHILRSGRRIGHLFTLPLCPDHHQDSGRPGFVARHPWKARFELRYGNEMDLLGRLRVQLGYVEASNGLV